MASFDDITTGMTCLSLSEPDGTPDVSTSTPRDSRPSSGYGQDQVERLFAPGTLNLHNMESFRKGGCKMKGTTYIEVFNNLVTQLNADGSGNPFSINSYDEVVKLGVMKKVPQQVEMHCNSIVAEHEKLFQDCSKIDGRTFLRGTLEKIYSAKSYFGESNPTALKTHEFLSALTNILSILLNREEWNVQISSEIHHRGWAEFYRTIISAVISGFTKETGNGEIFKTGNLLYNGMVCQQIVVAGHCLDELISTNIMPDMLAVVELVTCRDSKYILHTEVPAFVVEIKTSTQTIGDDPDAVFDFTHSEKTDSEPSSKRAKVSHKISRLEQLKTQHFLELLLLLRDEKTGGVCVANLEKHLKAFGFYIVMNKVFITSLTTHRNNKEMSHGRTTYFINEEKSENYKSHFEDGKRFSMKSTKFLNLFNALHLKALLAYIQFLVWHEYRYIR